MDLIAGVLKNAEGKYLIHKRPQKGLLANLWEFPNVEKSTIISPRTTLKGYLSDEYKADAKIETGSFTSIDHVFSHLTWNIEVFAGALQGNVEETDTVKLVLPEELTEYAFPVSHQKMWKAYQAVHLEFQS